MIAATIAVAAVAAALVAAAGLAAAVTMIAVVTVTTIAAAVRADLRPVRVTTVTIARMIAADAAPLALRLGLAPRTTWTTTSPFEDRLPRANSLEDEDILTRMRT